MKSVIIKPQNEILKKYVQYFLFFEKTDNRILNYTTFPNNNICLAIYKQNEVNYRNQSDVNNCIITKGSRNFISRIYGFHKTPFRVDINSCLDQICIIFYPSALKVFTAASYKDLISSDTIFNEIFSTNNSYSLEQLFDLNDFEKRAAYLENVLLKNLKDESIPAKLKEALYIIAENSSNINLSIETLTKKLEISDSTLFRLFDNHLGQNPKSYIKTLRFRKALNEILNRRNSFTEIAYLNQYYDQAHFINDFKTFSGHSPKNLTGQISVQQNDLAWIFNKDCP
ncbi:helix-turn-helix domain-containing protein [Pedobacter punctiformis]|uniref:AraC family transcriptional regulator n=1 Tax=Pedobacter punctiformis TaxID=3004097 RepID=A0ABT4L6N2_9SPHI|nr:AraC family transcriptional regulator [Pedobacter sp. HCMS5-2]MCZ4243582.1 AraC family transcriptional regulator [Pedobacter sp. HCMS5-2]